jgi:hypothetical protein
MINEQIAMTKIHQPLEILGSDRSHEVFEKIQMIISLEIHDSIRNPVLDNTVTPFPSKTITPIRTLREGCCRRKEFKYWSFTKISLNFDQIKISILFNIVHDFSNEQFIHWIVFQLRLLHGTCNWVVRNDCNILQSGFLLCVIYYSRDLQDKNWG